MVNSRHARPFRTPAFQARRRLERRELSPDWMLSLLATSVIR